MIEGDTDIDEKRVYGDRKGKTEVLVATNVGLVSVAVSDDVVGGFRLERRGAVRDVAVVDDRAVIATGEDVLIRGEDGEFEPTGFGPAEAVADGTDGPLAAGGGRIARLDDAWETLGHLENVRAIDGGLVAAASGVYRLDGSHAGLEDARDVAAAGPLAATASGLYRLGNGWMKELDAAVDVVASDGARSHAGGAQLYEYRDGEWLVADTPVDEPTAAVDYGPAVYAVTEPGTFLVNAGDGWRSQGLGTPGACGIAVE